MSSEYHQYLFERWRPASRFAASMERDAANVIERFIQGEWGDSVTYVIEKARLARSSADSSFLELVALCGEDELENARRYARSIRGLG